MGGGKDLCPDIEVCTDLSPRRTCGVREKGLIVVTDICAPTLPPNPEICKTLIARTMGERPFDSQPALNLSTINLVHVPISRDSAGTL